jgi:hypothetical protein
MDPLSVAASIVGLLAAAQQISSAMGGIASAKAKGSKELSSVKITVDTLRSILLQLQLLLLDRASINPERASLILVEEVVVTLTACVATFSDLDVCLKGLRSDEQLGLLDVMRWATKAPELKLLLQHLEAHKTSLILMLNIITW